MERYLITHSLLSSWLYAIDEQSREGAMDDFLKALNREPTPATDAMQKGIDFEQLVTDIAAGVTTRNIELVDAETNKTFTTSVPITEHEWYPAAKQIANIVRNGIFQYAAKRDVVISGRNVLLYGRLDALKAGHVYDIKFSQRYEVGKFFGSTQHPMYLNLVPEAMDFTYLVSNGNDVWKETYRRGETSDIVPVVKNFFEWLEDQSLGEIYRTRWLAL